MWKRLAAVLLFASSIAAAQPLSTAFTFQGELDNAGSPVSGTYDIRFILYDALTAGTQIGPTLCSDNVAITSGKFTVQLDFGSQFSGNQRFLEVQARQDTGLPCSNTSGFIILAPRQSLTASPNAVFALNSANAVTATSATSATTAATAANATQLNSQPASFYTNAANLTGTLPDARLSTNAALLTGTQTFSGAKSFSSPASFTIPTGTAPFSVSSTTKVTNLNAELLDGLDSTAFSLTSHTHDASAIITGLLADARLSANIPKLNTINLFTATQNFITAGSSPVMVSSPSTGGTYLGLSNTSAGGRGWNLVATGSASAEGPGRFLINDATAALTRVTIDANGRVGIGTTTPGYPLDVESGNSFTIYASNSNSLGAGIVSLATGTNGYGIEGDSSSPTGYGVVGGGRSFSGANRGVSGYTFSDTGTGVYGEAETTTGVNYGGFFHAASSNGFGLWAENPNDLGTAVFGYSAGASGYAVVGDSEGATGTAVEGAARAFSGANRGVYGYSNSTTGTGVYGSVGTSAGLNYGGFFHCASSAGYGLWAENTSSGNAIFAQSSGNDAIVGQTNASGKSSVFGVTSTPNANGGYFNSSANTGTGKGVVGQCNSASGYGVFSQGNTGASGTKSFRIDHPLDPTNKYLNHYCAEGPEPLNVYRGTARLDSSGEAVIDLPPYFAAINKDPSYQLTAVGAPMPLLHVDTEISEDALAQGAKAEPGQPVPACSFRIAGGAPNAKVSWEVKALRNDRWVQINGAPVEVEKLDREKGTYQHPELFHQPPERAANYESTRSHAPAQP